MDDASDQTQYDVVRPRQAAPTGLSDQALMPLEGVDWKSSFDGRFEPLGQLGCGGFAIVYRVFDRKLEREVALKVLRSSAQSDTESRMWLKREGLATASLKHPHIVTLYDFEATEHSCYLVSELIVGSTLAKFIEEHPDGCEPRVAAEIVMLLAEALSHAHSKNVLHRDIKPSNILLDSAISSGSLPFSPRLADFGLATSPTLESLSKSASNLMGTIYYLPPEIVNGNPGGFTAQGDIYALALVLRELLTGRRAVVGSTYSQIISQISIADFEQLRPGQSHIPADLLAICSQGMEMNPNKRYATAIAFADDLHNFLNGQPVSARLPNFRERTWRLIKRYPAISASASLLLLTLVSIATMALIADSRLSEVNRELEGRNVQLENALAESRSARNNNEQIIYSQDMALASELLEEEDVRGVRAILQRYSPGQPLHAHADLDYQLLRKGIQNFESDLMWTAPHALYTGCITSDGKELFLGGAGSQITVLRLDTAKVEREWDTEQVEINGIVVNAKSTDVWSTGNDGTVCDWRLSDNKLLWRTQVFDAPTEAHDLIYLEQVNRLVVLGSSAQLRILSADDGKLLTKFPVLDGKLSALANLRDGRQFLVGDTQSLLYKVDGESMQILSKLPIGTEKHPNVTNESIRYISVNPSGEWATVITRNEIVYLVDLVNWTVTDSLDSLEQPRITCFVDSEVGSVPNDIERLWLITRPGLMHELSVTSERKFLQRGSWAADGQRVFAAMHNSQTQQVLTLNAQGGVQSWSKPNSDWMLNSRFAVFTVQHWYSFLTVDSSKWLKISNNQVPQELFLFNGRKAIEIMSRNHPQLWLVNKLAVAALCEVGRTELWAMNEPKLARTISFQQLLDIVHSAAATDFQGEIELPWQERALPFRADEIRDASRNFRLVSSDSGQWIAGWDTEAQCVWCMRPDQPESVKSSPSKEVILVWFEPESHNLWWVSRHREIYRWSLDNGGPPQLITKLDNQSAKDLAISPDKNLLAIQHDDSSCILWDLIRNQQHSEIIHAERLLDITFAQSGRTLLLLGEKGRLACWNIASGRITYDRDYATENIFGGFSGNSGALIRSAIGTVRKGRVQYNGWKIESLDGAVSSLQ